MADSASITFIDQRHKASSMTINVAELSGANYDTIASNVATLKTALEGIVLSGHDRISLTTTDTSGAVGDDAGQRGSKAIVRWFSALENQGEGAYGNNEVGCVDPSTFTAVGDKLLLQGANYDAIKTAFDAVAKTENGNAVAVYEIEFVNRNVN